MKQLLLTISLCLGAYSIQAGAGFYDSFAIVDGNFFDLSAGTGNTDFQGANLGNIDLNTGTLFLGGQSKTFKDESTDVTGVAIFYRFYQGAASGAFNQINYNFQWNSGDSGAPSGLPNFGDQQWGTDMQGVSGSDVAVDILNGVSLTTGTYTLEVFMRVSTNGVDAAAEIFDSNGGNNYSATFTITNAMPVDFASILVKTTRTGNELAFSTATETNNSHFDIERSTNSRQWESLGRISGAGTTQERQSYIFNDKLPVAGTNYYRVKQVDYDGTFSYSDIVSAQWTEKPQLSIYPNPASKFLFIQGISENENTIQVEVFSINGQLLMSEDWNQQAIHIAFLPKGSYTIRLRSRQEILKQERIIIQ